MKRVFRRFRYSSRVIVRGVIIVVMGGLILAGLKLCIFPKKEDVLPEKEINVLPIPPSTKCYHYESPEPDGYWKFEIKNLGDSSEDSIKFICPRFYNRYSLCETRIKPPETIPPLSEYRKDKDGDCYRIRTILNLNPGVTFSLSVAYKDSLEPKERSELKEIINYCFRNRCISDSLISDIEIRNTLGQRLDCELSRPVASPHLIP